MTPSSRLLRALAIWIGLGALATLAGFQSFWAIATLFVLLAAFWDGLRLRATAIPILRRGLPAVWSQRRQGTVHLHLENRSNMDLDLEIFDHHPTGWATSDLPLRVTAPARQETSVAVRYIAPDRGDAIFHAADVRIASRWGLWTRQLGLGTTESVRVYPDLSRLAGHVLRGTDSRTPNGGAIRKRRRGEGTEFHQLREYRRGDSLRSIDWKATARMGKPISREYQEERDQQVVILLDGGRRMLARDGRLSHFDHVLESALSLAWIAQKQGDAVGLLSFGTDIRWVAPKKGRLGLDRLLGAIYDLQPTEAAPDYLTAAQDLLGHLHRRAFIILATNLRDEDDDNLLAALSLLRKRHLVLCANLQETILSQTQAEPVRDFPSALRLCATEEYLKHRREALDRLGLDRRTLVDAVPHNLASLLVDRYLELKDAGVL
ncbi:MAG: hypothetical protein RL173_1301 [Fibrobacterota bacterium]|jgi:uncharacterized protein (DUF58 family)